MLRQVFVQIVLFSLPFSQAPSLLLVLRPGILTCESCSRQLNSLRLMGLTMGFNMLDICTWEETQSRLNKTTRPFLKINRVVRDLVRSIIIIKKSMGCGKFCAAYCGAMCFVGIFWNIVIGILEITKSEYLNVDDDNSKTTYVGCFIAAAICLVCCIVCCVLADYACGRKR